jgi:hypothetical protein
MPFLHPVSSELSLLRNDGNTNNIIEQKSVPKMGPLVQQKRERQTDGPFKVFCAHAKCELGKLRNVGQFLPD